MTDPALLASTPSTAATLHRAGVPQVVAYFGPVGDQQSTRAEEAFYRELARGRTARQAVRAARRVSAQPLGEAGSLTHLYPLGWAQLALYHRGPDHATALPVVDPQAVASPFVGRRRHVDRLERRGEGVERLKFGFIGRRKSRSELYRKWRAGARLLIVQGLGGLGKTTLCTEMLPLLSKQAGGDVCRVVLDGWAAGQSTAPAEHLWRQIEAHGSGEAWQATLARLREPQSDGRELGFGEAAARALLALPEGKPLLVYLDDAESLQAEPGAGEQLAEWRDAELATFWRTLSAAIRPEGRVGMLVSCRFAIEGATTDQYLRLPELPKPEMVKLLRWFETLSKLPTAEIDWLASEVLDGHPRTVEFLEGLARERFLTQLSSPTNEYRGPNWRDDLLKPVLPATRKKVDADLLLPRLWAAIPADARELLGRCSVLDAPAPWPAILDLASELVAAEHPAEEAPVDEQLGTVESRAAALAWRLVDAGLLSPFAWTERRDDWWGPHGLVSQFVRSQWQGDSRSVHRRVGEWYARQFESSGDALIADRAVTHLLAAGEANAAWPVARLIVLALRKAGRFRDALKQVERVLDVRPTGPARGNALTFSVQLGILSGALPIDAEARLTEAEKLVLPTDRSFVLDELAKLYQRRGDFKRARTALERSIAVGMEVFGTEEHLSLAFSLHALAGVLSAQGDLSGARA
ncbi:MAG TPA: tetratricopeptide repeat protein, partial [Pirellulaceae bacterium]|nr:tetratricopeptide repeat protein [Pirellulaceae bacterium]